MTKLIGKIKNIPKVQFYSQVNLKKYTTYKLEVIGDIAICLEVKALKELISILNKSNYKYNIVGWGANQVLYNTKDVLFIKLDFEVPKNLFNKPQEKYYLPASTPLNRLTSHAQKFGLKGWEVFTGIPASLGGAIFMNAGTGLGEICEIVESVEVMHKNGEIRVIKGDDLNFSYRSNNFVKEGEVIVAATLIHKGIDLSIKDIIKDYTDYRKKTQPINSKNCGCVFKNHSSKLRAGHQIDLVGLKGLEVGGLRVSLMHANFIENFDNATSQDFFNIVDLILDELEYCTGIRFELEAKIY